MKRRFDAAVVRNRISDFVGCHLLAFDIEGRVWRLQMDGYWERWGADALPWENERGDMLVMRPDWAVDMWWG